MKTHLSIFGVVIILACACDSKGGGAALESGDGAAVSRDGAGEDEKREPREVGEDDASDISSDPEEVSESDRPGEDADPGEDAASSADDEIGDSGAADADLQDGAPPHHPVGAPAGDLDVIESVAFEDVDGVPEPFLLFKAGYGSFNVEQIVHPIDIAYDLVEHPQAWPAWRRTPQGVERQTANGWLPLTYKYECAPLPEGTTLNGVFEERLSAVVGGGVASRQWVIRYRFSDDGSFEVCDAQKTAIVATGSVKTQYTQAKGTYEIDGYTIRFTRDDGTEVAQPFFFDPNRPTRVWIDRGHFPIPKAANSAICVAP